MSDVLRNPWLLSAALYFLGQPNQTQISSPQLAQLTDIQQDGEFAKGKISDKFNFNIAIISPDAIKTFHATHPNKSLESLRGAIIKIKRFTFGSLNSNQILPVVIENFEPIGCEGSSVHGDPRYLLAVPLIVQILEQMNTGPANSQTFISQPLMSSFCKPF